jgi:hypothetical protein
MRKLLLTAAILGSNLALAAFADCTKENVAGTYGYVGVGTVGANPLGLPPGASSSVGTLAFDGKETFSSPEPKLTTFLAAYHLQVPIRTSSAFLLTIGFCRWVQLRTSKSCSWITAREYGDACFGAHRTNQNRGQQTRSNQKRELTPERKPIEFTKMLIESIANSLRLGRRPDGPRSRINRDRTDSARTAGRSNPTTTLSFRPPSIWRVMATSRRNSSKAPQIVTGSQTQHRRTNRPFPLAVTTRHAWSSADRHPPASSTGLS